MGNGHDAEQDVELQEHEGRLAQLEDRLSTTFPTPDTPVGGAQRFRFAVPTPETVFTLGARGSATSAGSAIGPGGIAFRTVDDFAAEIRRHTILTSVGHTIVNTDGHMRLLADQDVGISSGAHVLVGSLTGNVELTAGDAGFADPEFTVEPSMDVPAPPEVDTRSPRETTESVHHGWFGVWAGIKSASQARKWLRSPTAGGQVPSISPPAMAIVRSVATVVNMARTAIEVGIAAIEYTFDDHDDEVGSHGPAVLVHGAGGVALTTPRKVTGFGVQGVKMESPNKAELKGGVKAAVNSAVYASVYGAMCAGLKSDGVAYMSATSVGLSGDYAEITGREGAALSSSGVLAIESTSFIAMRSPRTMVMGDDLVLVGNTKIDARSPEIHSEARNRYLIKSLTSVVEVDGHQRLELRVGGAARVMATSSSLELSAGSFSTRIDRNSMRIGNAINARSGEIVLRGRVRMA